MLQELIRAEAVKVNLESDDKDEVFEEMTEVLCSLCPTVSRSEILDSLFERENKMSTGIMPGIAIPHAISARVKEPVCAVGISKEGIDYNSLDGKPVHVIFMFVFPSVDAEVHLKIMQSLAFIFGLPDFYNNLLSKTTGAQVVQAITAAEDSL